MGIGTSLGAYFENDFSHQAGIEDHTHDPIERTPSQVDQNKQLEKVDNDELGGIEVSKKDKMPFPNNRNPDMDFNSRFGNLPPSGILNDLKPQDQTPPLVRRISDVRNINPMNDTENGTIPLGSAAGTIASIRRAPSSDSSGFINNAGRAVGNLARSEIDNARNTYRSVVDYLKGDESRSQGSDTITNGNVVLKRQDLQSYSGLNHEFKFYHEDTGTLGTLQLKEKDNGRTLHVSGIGLADGINPNTIGTKGIRDLLGALKQEFPEARYLEGFRVSGARASSGEVGTTRMLLRPLGDTNAHRF